MKAQHTVRMLGRIVSALLIIMIVGGSLAGCVGRGTTRTATLVQVSGEVQVMELGSSTWARASKGTVLEPGDHVKTLADSSALIILFDGSVIELDANTELSLDELFVTEEGSTVIKLKQEIGKTSSRVEKLVDPASRYEVETPAGAAVVRGTTMGVTVLADGLTIIDCIKGQCWAIAQGKEVALKAGMRSIIVPGETPRPATQSTAPSPAAPSAAPATSSTSGVPNIEGDPLEAAALGLGSTRTPATPRVTTRPPRIRPRVLTEDATLGENQLTLNGRLVYMGSASTVTVSFLWGTSPGVYSHETSPQAMNSIGSFSFDLDLDSDESTPITIYFKAKAVGDGTSYGEEKAFIRIPPVVLTEDATPGKNQVRLNGSLVSMGSASSVAVSFLWGTSSGDYTDETTPQVMNSTGPFSFDLDLGEYYEISIFFKAKAVGDGTSYGEEKAYFSGYID